MYKSVCFTGHRNISITDKLRETLTNRLESLIQNGATDFYAGGAVGWDMLCEQIVLELREKYPQIKLHLVLPCPADEQTAKWNKKDKHEYIRILSLADTVEVCSEHYHRNCMKKRNARLVELADCCACYYDNQRSRSGTGQTVRMAESQPIRIINLLQ